MKGTVADYSKYRWVTPTSYLTCWLCIILGPFFFPSILQSIFEITNTYGLLRLAYMVLCAAVAVYKVLSLPRRNPNEQLTPYFYAWVIPSYREPEEVIALSLQKLAQHPRAKSKYLIFLAMEDHERGAREKAQRIIASFSNQFCFMGFNLHSIKDGEARGKASNVSSCVENMEHILPAGQFKMSDLFITVMDCDSWAPAEYIDEVEAYTHRNPNKARRCVFNPTQIFKRNDQEVPVTTRSFDNFHCYAHWATAVSIFEVSSPFSNYTLNYDLIKSVGFWDKHADAIAEDIHTFAKLFWVTSGDVYSITINTPFNQLNIQCDGSYLDNVKEKFWQAVRHGLAIHETAYNLHGFHFARVKKSFRDFAYIVYFIDTVMFHTCFTTYLLLFQLLRAGYYNFQYQFLAVPITLQQKNMISDLQFMTNLSVLLTLASILLFEVYKRYSNKRFYGGKNESWWKVWEYFVFMGFGLYAFFATSFLWATFKPLFKTMEYRVAGKLPTNSNNKVAAKTA